MQENVRNAAHSLPEFSRHTTIASVMSVHDLPPCPNESVTGDWKRSRSEKYIESPAGSKSLATRSENSARPAKDSLDEEDHFLQESKMRATSATTAPAGTNLNRD